MLSRKFLAFLLIVQMVTCQTVYPTTSVSYSTNSVPTIQTFPASYTTVSAAPTVISATMPATVTATAVPATSKPTCVAATPMPSATPTVSFTSKPSLSTPTVSFSSMPSSSTPNVSFSTTPSSVTTSETGPKVYFLPANIPEPKVTVLANDKPSIVGPKLYKDYVDVKPTLSRDLPSKFRRDGPMTPAKRLTMACTDDVPTFLDGQPFCPSISKMDITPPLGLKKDIGSSNNPIDFEGLFDSFLTCL